MGPKLKSAIFKAPYVNPKRRRTKKLHKELLDQLEFYFSEANLRHDAFMREKTGDSGINDVPVQLFLSFPLIQEMDVSEKDIISAVQNSIILELSQDKTHLHRRYPVPMPPHNLEESTLYIENLPPDSTTEWLKEVCQKLGTVRHISLPRYKKSGQIKGFAFVEYSSPEDVARACCVLRDPPNNFFPSRTENYQKHLKRIQWQKNSQMIPMTPTHTQSMPRCSTPSSDSSLNKSIDSAIEFEQLKQETPNEISICKEITRKRRRSRRASEFSPSTFEESDADMVANHKVAKKRKSVPVNINLNGIDTSEDSTTEPQSTVTSSKKKKGRKVDFSIETEEVLNFVTAAKPMVERTLTDKDSGDINNVPDDAPIKIIKAEDLNDVGVKNLNDESIGKINHQTTPSAIENNDADKKHLSLYTLKRRRSASEPVCSVDEEGNAAKRPKDDILYNAILKPAHDTILAEDINELISIGRLTAQEMERKDSTEDSPKKPALQSVIAKPTSTPKKSCQHSRKSRQRKKINAGRAPPNLTVMPKTHWSAFKEEYKRLQKQNMSRLKMTIRENKDAGSVFIKKHLDVLHDIRVGNVTGKSKVMSGIKDVREPIKEHTLMKRGAPTFQPGVIVKITNADVSASPPSGGTEAKLPSVEEIKTLLNKYGQGVAYVDLTPGDGVGFVRFNDGESAQRAIMEEKSLALCLLTGEMEEKYWDKLLASRARKFSKERPKIRGRTKILSKAEILVEKGKRKHIRFDNDYIVV